MKHTIELNERQLEILHDLLQERLEDLNEDISHFETHPDELEAMNQEDSDDEPLSLEDYEHYRDEVQTLKGLLPEA